MYEFQGRWITHPTMADYRPRQVFSRQLSRIPTDPNAPKNQHILLRRRFTLGENFDKAVLTFSADDNCRIYLNGQFVTQGPCPGYHIRYPYRQTDVTEFLQKGENILAIHVYYQGLINRVWQSGDLRSGWIGDLEVDGKVILSSDESFLTCLHEGFRAIGTVGYETSFLEEVDSRAAQVGFEQADFNDTAWEKAAIAEHNDHGLRQEPIEALQWERIAPETLRQENNRIFLDFGKMYAGNLALRAKGEKGSIVTVRCAQELTQEGEPRFALRSGGTYEESWILAEGESLFRPYDYKAFRYCEILLPEGAELLSAELQARHYPFRLQRQLRAEYQNDPKLRSIWDLCLHTLAYGAQEGILDCMEREKGNYLGDGCYTTLTHAALTGDDALLRHLIDEAFASSFITKGLVTCLACSFMQEIAEYPLILVETVLWHYRLFGDRAYLQENYAKVTTLLDCYRQDYEEDLLLRRLDKWCVVEWPDNFRDGYDVDLTEGQICEPPHCALQAYYLRSIDCANEMARILDRPAYRDTEALREAFISAFYDPKTGLFRDSETTQHTSLPANIYPFAFHLCPDAQTEAHIAAWILEKGMHSLSFFTGFAALQGFAARGNRDAITQLLRDEAAWLRMLREGATATFESWGKETKWNTSLFHMTLSFAALFLSDAEAESLFKG